MKISRTRKLAASLFVAAAAAATAVAFAPAASAASAASTGWVYVSTPTWLGNCVNAGSVNGLYASVGNTWTSNGYDAGDDIVYAKVYLGADQQFSYTAHCSKWPGSWQPGVAQNIRPTRNGQTVWVGPAGVRYN